MEDIKLMQQNIAAGRISAMDQTATSTSPAPDSNQAAAAEDVSAKTIEFLRARLLAERAASRAARNEAQETSVKVKVLNTQLEAEMESRKAAEAAMGRVCTVLKAKGLDMEALIAEHQAESVGSTVDDIKEMNIKCPANPCINKADAQGATHSVMESHAGAEEENPSSPQNHHCKIDQLALRDKPVVYTDKTSATSMPASSKDQTDSSQASKTSSSVMQKLKAMVQQIEEEVVSLPAEQKPLKIELQGWVDHVARVLDIKTEAVMQMHTADGAIKAAASSSPFKETAASKNGTNNLTADNNGLYPPITYPLSMGRDSALLSNKICHNRLSSTDSPQFWQEPLNAPMQPRLMKNGISYSLRYPDSFTPNSPRRSDAGFLQEQGKVPGLEGQARYRNDALDRQYDMRSPIGAWYRQPLRPYVVDEIHMTQDRYMDRRHIPINKMHAYPHRSYIQAQHPMSNPPHDPAALPLVDVKKGRLGDILTALDAARQNVVNEEQRRICAKKQLFGADPAPMAEKTKLNGGYNPCGDEHMWRSPARSQMPIIQFPPSPASSDHGRSPFERHSRHRRSSSVSTTTDMVSSWQHKGEVQLGNGITLYTD